MSKKQFYAILKGHQTGIFHTWAKAQPLVNGFSGAVFKGFVTKQEAEDWVKQHHKVPVIPSLPHVNLKEHKPFPNVVKPNTDIVYCDGACSSNGTDKARAGIGVYFGSNDSRNESSRLSPKVYRQTNQVAELMAAITALKKSDPTRSLIVRTDSIYVVKGVNEWRHAWKKKNWDGIKIVNKALFRDLSDLVDKRPLPVLFEHVKGHGTSYGNIQADALATAGAAKEE